MYIPTVYVLLSFGRARDVAFGELINKHVSIHNGIKYSNHEQSHRIIRYLEKVHLNIEGCISF